MTKIAFIAASISFTCVGEKIEAHVTSPEFTIDGANIKAGNNEKVSSLLASLLAGLVVDATEVTDGAGAKIKMVNSDDVVEFIRANPGKSIEELATQFAMDIGAATHMTAFLAARGKVVGLDVGETITFTVQDADDTGCGCGDVTHTSSTPSAPAETPVVEVPVATLDSVVAFLRSDTRFEYRTETAMFKHFAGDGESLLNILHALIVNGAVTTKRRRRDGETLFKAAPVQAAAETTAAPVQAPAETTAAPVGNAGAVTGDEVLAFLTSDDRYEFRTGEAIDKHFDGRDGIGEAVETLVNNGDVTVKHRRADGVALFKAVALVATPESAAEAYGDLRETIEQDAALTTASTPPAFNYVNLREFLTSDPRYTKRTAAAIAKHFWNEGDIPDQLDEMVVAEDLYTVTRRRDGATLYAVTN